MRKTAILGLIFVLCACLMTGCRRGPASETTMPTVTMPSITVPTQNSTQTHPSTNTRPSTQTTTPSTMDSTSGTEGSLPGGTGNGATDGTGRSRYSNNSMR